MLAFGGRFNIITHLPLELAAPQHQNRYLLEG
jgi:hypothetical protein